MLLQALVVNCLNKCVSEIVLFKEQYLLKICNRLRINTNGQFKAFTETHSQIRTNYK